MTQPKRLSRPVTLWMVSYDIVDDRRRAGLARLLESCGRRVQYSVFECRLNPSELLIVKSAAQRWVDPREDSLRWYPLCVWCRNRVRRHGVGLGDRALGDKAFYIP